MSLFLGSNKTEITQGTSGFSTSHCLQPFLDDVEVSEEELDQMKDYGDNKINYLEDIG